MDNKDAFNILKEYLLTHFPDAKVAAGGKEIVKRCHYCGDSRRQDARHLYIGINDKGVIAYHCFKCNAGGVVNYKFFRDLGIYDTELIDIIGNANKRVSNGKGYSNYGENDKKAFYQVPVWNYVDDNRSSKKLDYINNRLGISLALEDMSKLKIVLNIKEWLLNNNIKFFSRHPDIMNELDIGFLGFLSIDNSHIVLRRLVPEDKVHPTLRERYNIYNIFSKMENGVNYYTIPGTVNRFMPVNIIITEGPFDILSVYMNLPRYDNSIYISATGKTNYIGALNYLFYKINIPMIGSIIHVYSDNDVTKKDIDNLWYYARSKSIELRLHYNLFTGEKDYGVSGDRIIDSTTILYDPKGNGYDSYKYNPFDNHICINGFTFQ